MSARKNLEYIFNSTMASCDALDAIDTLDAYAHELAEQIRSEVPRGYCPCADLIDPEVQR